MFDWIGFGQDLLGTLIGAGLGLACAMWWDRQKDRADIKARRLRTILAIREEIDGTSSSLEIPQLDVADAEGGAVKIEMSVPFLLSAAFETAIHSGNLALLPSKAQATLSSFYEHLRIARLGVDVLTTNYAHGGNVSDGVTRIQNAANYLQGHCEMLRGQVPDVREALDLAERAARRGADAI